MRNVNIAPLRKLLPGSFEYAYNDPDLVEHKELIEIQCRRMESGVVMARDFQDLIANIHTDPGPIFGILAKLVGDWNLTIDDEPFPPTEENLRLLPPDFIRALAESVFGLVIANPQKAESSEASSAPAERLATAATSSSNNTPSELPLDIGE